VDKLVGKFREQGVKIILGKNPDSGNIFVIPAEEVSDINIENNNLPLRHLAFTDGIDD
jgi:hypothetical protein